MTGKRLGEKWKFSENSSHPYRWDRVRHDAEYDAWHTGGRVEMRDGRDHMAHQ
jgi:hypothetical protein